MIKLKNSVQIEKKRVHAKQTRKCGWKMVYQHMKEDTSSGKITLEETCEDSA